MFDFDDLEEEEKGKKAEEPKAEEKPAEPEKEAPLCTEPGLMKTDSEMAKDKTISEASPDESKKLLARISELKKEIEKEKARRASASGWSGGTPQGLQDKSRQRSGPLVTIFRTHTEDCYPSGIKAGTIIRMCERNRNETFTVYAKPRESMPDHWLGVLVEVCLEVTADFFRLCRQGNIEEGHYFRIEHICSYDNYPFRIEEEKIYHCGQPFQEPGVHIATFRGLGCTVTDPGGSGTKFELLSSTEKDKYFSMYADNTKYHQDGVEKLKDPKLMRGLAALHPVSGRKFTPQRSWTGIMFCGWWHGDIYNTLFHPIMPDVLAHVHRQAGLKIFAGLDITGTMFKMFGKVEPYSNMEIFLFIDEVNKQELFVFKNFEDTKHAWCGIAKFSDKDFQFTFEELSAANNCPDYLMKWARHQNPKNPMAEKWIDMSQCKRV